MTEQLGRVFQALVDNVDEDELDVLAALSQTVDGSPAAGDIAAYLRQVAASNRFIVNLDGAVTISDDKSTVTAKGKTPAFLEMTLDVALVFTMDAGIVSCALNLTGAATWDLGGVQWFAIREPRIGFVVPNANTPALGSIGGTVAIASGSARENLALSMAFPGAGEPWDIRAVLSEPLSVDTIFQLVGGINLVQSLPPPLSTVLPVTHIYSFMRDAVA